MDRSIKLNYILASLLLIVTVTAVCSSYASGRQLRAADQAASADAATIVGLQHDRDARDEADTMHRADERNAEAAVKSSSDAVRVITKFLPSPVDPTELPASIVVPPSDVPEAERLKLPAAPSYVLQTQSEAVAVARNFLSCAADRQTLATCKADLADADGQRAAETHTADNWKAVAKGGTKAKRVLSVLKCAATAAAGGYLGALTKQPQWAAAGAGAGAVVCHLF